jgi:hypothetical protein
MPPTSTPLTASSSYPACRDILLASYHAGEEGERAAAKLLTGLPRLPGRDGEPGASSRMLVSQAV